MMANNRLVGGGERNGIYACRQGGEIDAGMTGG